MAVNPNSPILIVTVVGVLLGGYLIVRPAEYKAGLRESGENPISRSPSWVVRILGLLLILIVVCVTYWALTAGK